jgi:hypothetical protein
MQQLGLDFAAPRAIIETSEPDTGPSIAETPDPCTEEPTAGSASNEASLAARLDRALDVDVELVVTDNRRRMISSRRRAHGIEVRVHRIFLDAPDDVIDHLIAYLKNGDPRATRALGRYVQENRALITKERRKILLRARGKHYDLAEIFEEVVRDHFDDYEGGATITWGRMPPGRRRRSIRFGTYTHEQKLIRIHPSLDDATVPRFFVAFVVFHELLHHVVPPRRSKRRIDYHPPEFRARERAHPDYARAISWETAHIDELLRTPPKPRRRLR